MTRLRDLPGLGPKSEACLMAVGINTEQELRELGALQAFMKLKAQSTHTNSSTTSLNFLYALVGAIEGISWQQVARERRLELLMQIEALEELQAIELDASRASS